MPFATDFLTGLRQIRKNPGSALLAVVAYALGLGTVGFMLTVIFGWARGHPETVEFNDVQAVRWDPSTRHLWESGSQNEKLVYPDFREIHEAQTVFQAFAALQWSTFNVRIGDYAERFQGSTVTADFFDVFAFQPQLGRFFFPGDDAPGSEKKAVISDHFWRNVLSADPSVVGKHLTVDGLPTEIIGIAKPGVDFPSQVALWINETADPLSVDRGAGDFYDVVGRLKTEHSAASALAELNIIASRMAKAHPDTNTGYISMDFQSLSESFIGEDFVRLLYLMFGCSLMVLLIACTNIANLTLSRATTRVKELAIRASLGGSRGRLVKQMLFEGFALAVIGGIGGLIVAIWTAKAIWGWIMANADITGAPAWLNLEVDLRVIASLSVITLLASLIASIVPAFKASRADLNEILKDNARGATGLKIGFFSKLLVFFQLCISCGLLIATSAMLGGAQQSIDYDPPYDPSGMMVGRFDLPETYSEHHSRAQLLRQLREKLEANPALEGVGFTSAYDMIANWDTRWDARGRERTENNDYISGRQEVVSENYFQLLDIPIVEGRGFRPTDAGENAQPVCLVNTLFAERVWPGENPIGKQIRDVWDDGNPWLTVVGVVPDTQMAGPGRRSADERGGVYQSMSSAPQASVTVFARTAGDPLEQTGAIRNVLQEVEPNVALYRVKTVAQAVEDNNFGSIFFRNMFGLFGIAALTLASIGVYGVMDFSVRQRFEEYGIRQALGARKAAILGHIFRLGAIQIAVGILFGIALGWLIVSGIGQAMGGFELTSLHYLAPTLIIAAIATLALFSPAREVTNANLADCLRDE